MVRTIFANHLVRCIQWKAALGVMLITSACSTTNAADAPASSSDSQSPIEFQTMTRSEFNKGRPADFYFLAYAKEGKEAVCAEILSALNIAYSREPGIRIEAFYAYLLLENELSVPWKEIPYYYPVGLNDYLARHARIDINSDGVMEDVILNTTSVSSIPFHALIVTPLGVLPDEIEEVSVDMSLAIRDSGGDLRGYDIFNKMRKYLRENFEDYGSTGFSILDPFFEIASVENRNYILLTTRDFIGTRIDVFVFSILLNDSLSVECRNTSHFQVMDR